MNPEICKSCPKLKGKNWNIYTWKNVFLGGINYIPFILDNDNKNGKWLCKMQPANKQRLETNEITVHKDCPYYMEHKLYDWNKNES